METVRQKWTDERLDDLNHRVDGGFRESREEMRALRAEMNARFDSLEGRFDGRFNVVEGHLGSVEARLDALQRTMIQGFVGMTTAIVAALIGLIATQL